MKLKFLYLSHRYVHDTCCSGVNDDLLTFRLLLTSAKSSKHFEPFENCFSSNFDDNFCFVIICLMAVWTMMLSGFQCQGDISVVL